MNSGFHRERQEGWRQTFGQTGAAESHLRNQQVNVGDIFLFFGWFKQTSQISGKYRYKSKAPDLHVIYGWLQIGEIIKINELSEVPNWMKSHPHILGKQYGDLDTLYVASENLTINGGKTAFSGSGYFDKVSQGITLTAEGQTRSVWELPAWFHPGKNKPPLSYNENKERWSLDNGVTRLRVASRGQEFVLNTDFYPEASDWLLEVISMGKMHML